MRRLRSRMNSVTGMKAYLQPVQDLTVEDRVSRTQFQYTIQDTNEDELNNWTAKILDKLPTLPQLEDVVTDQLPNGNTIDVKIDRETASRMGISPQNIDDALYDAFGQRQVSTLYTQTNLYHVILEALPSYQSSVSGLQDIYLQGSNSASSSGMAATNDALLTASSTSGVGSAPSSGVQTSASNQLGATPGALSSTSSSNPVPLTAFTTISADRAPLTINHQAQFPVVTISFNLAQGTHLSQAVNAVDKAVKGLDVPASVQTRWQGTAASYASSLNNEGLLLLAAMLTVYIVLGVLYESFIHPLTILSTLPSAGVGALLALWIFGQDLGIVSIIGIILLDRHRAEKRDHDGRLRTGSRAHPGQGSSRRNLPGLPAALPSHYHDHAGGAVRRTASGHGPRHWRRAAPSSGHRHGRRPAGEPGAHALHHAHHLSLVRSSGPWPSPPRSRGWECGDCSGRGDGGMKLLSHGLQRPVATALLTAAVAIAGTFAFTVLPVSTAAGY